ncbi:hypothetical protein [Spirosoma sp. KNUC1025]|uniref:hypothetical protein n=1 Tax=Spirosoma sp. KNUC1025 TaxID=2894082 RepID=UPI00386FD644|nr:hypothetical protein LN737_12375 [Spirosoma sp. KNUC1025]
MKSSTRLASADLNGRITHVTYQIEGFDRLSFVSDIAAIVPQDDSYSIRALCFEADGVQAYGVLTVRMREENRQTGFLVQRLQSVLGIVSVREIKS